MGDEVMKANEHYTFKMLLSPYEQWKLFKLEQCDGYERTLAIMEMGYVRLTAVAYAKEDEYAKCYDVYVKDRANAKEWTFYDSIYENVYCVSKNLEEAMKETLLKFLTTHGLSYTECNFPKKSGKKAEERCVSQ